MLTTQEKLAKIDLFKQVITEIVMWPEIQANAEVSVGPDELTELDNIVDEMKAVVKGEL